MQYDSRTGISKIETPDEIDDTFFSIHGVGNNPVVEKIDSVKHMIDPNEPTLQEVRFCKHIIKGMSRIEAYRKAFEVDTSQVSDRAAYSAINRLLERPRVAKKLYELREILMEMEDTDLMAIIHDLNEDRKLARDLGQPSAAIAATKVKATLLGLTNESKTTNNITVNLSDEQKKGILSRLGHNLLDVTSPPIEDADFEEIK